MARLRASWGLAAGLCLLTGPALADDKESPRPAQPGETRVSVHVPGELVASGLNKRCDYRTPLWSHEVATGEHLGLIAGRYGVLRQDIIDLNPALQKNPDFIRPGQKVLVCPEIAPTESVEIEYEVQKGDNLTSIARRYEMSVSELQALQADGVADPNKIRVGQKLHLWVPGSDVDGFSEADLRPPRRHASAHKVAAQLKPGPGYVIKRPYLAYGTDKTVSVLRKVVDRYTRRANGGPKVRVGDISKRGGGKLPPHLSHRRGVDVDVGLIHKGELKDHIRFVHATPDNLDVARTWLLVEEFLKTGQCRYIFLDYEVQKQLYEHAKKRGVPESRLDEYFQYPRGKRRNYGIIRHWRSHKGHIHVRFK